MTEGLGKEKRVRADVREAGKGVLLALEKWGVLGQGQIEALLFDAEMSAENRSSLFFNGTLSGRHYRSSYKVLKRLEAAGLVRLHLFPNASLYTLTGRGHAYLTERRLARLPGFRWSIAPGLVPHEVLTNGVGMVVDALLGLPVSTEFERYIRSRHAKKGAPMRLLKLPDLWISDGEHPKAVEIERTLKEADRYRQLWTAYRAGLPRNAVVLYVTAWPNGAKAILSRARDLLMDFIYVCDLADFEKSLGTCTFADYRGNRIRLEKRPGQPQGPQHQRVAPASLSARQDASAGERHPGAPSAPPTRSGRIGSLIPPDGGRDQSVSPLELRPFPHPHPRTPSPSPEGADGYRWTRPVKPKGGIYR